MTKERPRPCIHHVHNPLLRGKALLFQPEGVLIRWPDKEPVPAIGADFTGTAVHVPPEILEPVLTLLFGRCALARSDAAKRLARRARYRRLLEALFSRSYVQKFLACNTTLDDKAREKLRGEGEGQGVSYKKLLQHSRAAPQRVKEPSEGAEVAEITEKNGKK